MLRKSARNPLIKGSLVHCWSSINYDDEGESVAREGGVQIEHV